MCACACVCVRLCVCVCVCVRVLVCTRPPEGGMIESQSWVTAKAQEMFNKTGNWSPERPYPDHLHDNRHNPQTVEMREMGRDGYTEPCHPMRMDRHGRTISMPRLSDDNQVSTFIPIIIIINPPFLLTPPLFPLRPPPSFPRSDYPL
uniref:Secreted protein n=1 Tax=Hucho hucho TaxID=62062 RepID=A0A4W5KJW1_9TELE